MNTKTHELISFGWIHIIFFTCVLMLIYSKSAESDESKFGTVFIQDSVVKHLSLVC